MESTDSKGREGVTDTHGRERRGEIWRRKGERKVMEEERIDE